MPDESNIDLFTEATVKLLPPGTAFRRDRDSQLAKLIEALSVEPARVYEKQIRAIEESIPDKSTVEGLLPQWEEILGLPNPCAPLAETESGRKASVKAALRGQAGHAASVFESTAEALGFTDLEYTRYPAFTAGSTAGSSVYGDGWANVVHITASETDTLSTSEELGCLFDQIKRAHGYVDLLVEGPVGATRTGTVYYNNIKLDASTVLASVSAFSIQYGGDVGVQVKISASGGGVTTSLPDGAWKLYCSCDGVTFSHYAAADAILADVAAPGDNSVVDEIVKIPGVPGTSAKLVYERTDGGGSDVFAYVYVSAW